MDFYISETGNLQKFDYSFPIQEKCSTLSETRIIEIYDLDSNKPFIKSIKEYNINGFLIYNYDCIMQSKTHLEYNKQNQLTRMLCCNINDDYYEEYLWQYNDNGLPIIYLEVNRYASTKNYGIVVENYIYNDKGNQIRSKKISSIGIFSSYTEYTENDSVKSVSLSNDNGYNRQYNFEYKKDDKYNYIIANYIESGDIIYTISEKYDTNDRLISVHHSDEDELTEYEYDDYGNEISRVSQSTIEKRILIKIYDINNNLVHYEIASQEYEEPYDKVHHIYDYEYDEYNRRIKEYFNDKLIRMYIYEDSRKPFINSMNLPLGDDRLTD